MGNKFKLHKLGDNSLWILEQVAQGGFDITETLVTSYIYAFLPQLKYSKRSKGYIERVVERLEQSNIIVKHNKTYRLSSKGRWEIARRRLLDNPENHVRHMWDRKWRIVIFDIPEIERQHRDVLRYAIKSYGMYQLQQSVWVYPYQCEKFIDSIKEDLGFRAEVLCIVADTIENQSKLEEEFGLL